MFRINEIAARSAAISLATVIFLTIIVVPSTPVSAQDLPPTSPNVITVEAGSYVIPMDNSNQGLVAPFNLKAYGLANAMLQNNIPLLWAIKSGKAKDDIDFTATAKRIVPSATAPASVNFSGGPFVIPKAFAAVALPIINTWNGLGYNIAVYELTANASVDVRYTLLFKPKIYVGSSNATIHTNIFNFAVIPNYTVGADTVITSNYCASLVTQAHTSSALAVAGIKSFAQNGGNLFTQCLAANTYENDPGGRFQSTLGFTISNVNTTLTYPNGDMPISQFIGALEPAPGGSEQDWTLAAGSVPQNGSFSVAQNSGAHTNKFAAVGSKLYYGGFGGMAFVLGGHNYGAGGTALGDINGQRMLLNAVFVPPTRPAVCDISFGPSASNVSFIGVVRDSNRRPIRNVRVALFIADTNEFRYAMTNSFGYFTFRDLSTSNLYAIYFSSKTHEFPNSGNYFTLSEDLHMEFVGNLIDQNPPVKKPEAEPIRKTVLISKEEDSEESR